MRVLVTQCFPKLRLTERGGWAQAFGFRGLSTLPVMM
jgi:hypothetical protein